VGPAHHHEHDGDDGDRYDQPSGGCCGLGRGFHRLKNSARRVPVGVAGAMSRERYADVNGLTALARILRMD